MELRALEKRAQELEAKVAELETLQAEQSAQLADPSVYEDAARRQALTQAVTRSQAELEVAMDTWAEVQEAIETHRGSDDAPDASA